MEHKLNTVKTDFYNVFVKGNASNIQITRVFIVLAIQAMVLLMAGMLIIK